MMSVIATPTPVSVKSFSIDSFVTEFLRSSTTTSPRGFGSAYDVDDLKSEIGLSLSN